ncbi:MAG: RagB/SusD family nutrient uptake outer membrane protein [Bacteroidales bacterium]|nr:RagB/SusD family nutrient uptake outer membrane protein [Bacteroidales bacterium]
MKLNRLFILSASVLMLSACEGFLDKTPLVQMGAETYYSNEDELNAAALGTYAVMQNETYQLGHYMVWGDVCSDDADLGNNKSDAYNWFGGNCLAMQDFSMLPTNGQATGHWNQGWTMINAATQLIENGKDKNDIPNKDRYVGEGYFLRAYAYFNLLTQYADAGGQWGLPIVDHILTYDEYYMPRATLADTWTHIENDLKKAAELLPEKWDGANIGRVTKGAAMSLLGKSYIYQSKWQNAYDILQDVEEAGWYKLEPKFADVFALSHENGIESIFEIQHSISGTGWSDSNEGSIIVFYNHDAGIKQSDIDAGYVGADEKVSEKCETGWSMHCPTDDLIAAFEPGDPRLGATVIAPNEFYDGHIHYNLGSNNGYQPKKFYTNFADRFAGDESDLPTNIIVIRYADVLLFLAEASNELGKSGEALAYLEQVRGRARSNSDDPTVLPKVTTTNKDELREAIWHERRVELALEYHRTFDLVRQGRFGKVMKAYYEKYKDVEVEHPNMPGVIYKTNKGKNFVEGKNEYCPLPQRAIDDSRGSVVQNSGY